MSRHRVVCRVKPIPAYSKPPQPPQDLSHGKDGWSVNVSFAPTFRHRFHFDGGHRVLRSWRVGAVYRFH